MPSVEPKQEPMSDDEMITCGGCKGVISDRFYLLAADKKWHANCLRCCECKTSLDSNATCFARDGNVYCKEDYYKRFAMKRCARCHIDISSNELVMKARQFVYHLHCFSCSSCGKVLSTGEYFGMRDEVLFCKTHYEHPEELPIRSLSPSQELHDFPKSPHDLHSFDFQPHMGSGNGMGNPPMMGESPHPGMLPQMGLHAHAQHHHGGPQSFYNGVGATQKGRPRKRKNQHIDNGLMCDGDEMTMTSDGLMLATSRQKRIRTSFKHQQLRVLKSYFALNQNPDAKDLKQLAQKTGLPKRVLQVWFQNARAKYRRNMLKQQNDPQSNNLNNPKSSPGDSEFSPNNNNNQSMDSSEFPDIPDMRNSNSPTNMSDLSSTPSLTDLHPGTHAHMGRDPNDSGSNFADMFSHVSASMGGLM